MERGIVMPRSPTLGSLAKLTLAPSIALVPLIHSRSFNHIHSPDYALGGEEKTSLNLGSNFTGAKTKAGNPMALTSAPDGAAAFNLGRKPEERE